MSLSSNYWLGIDSPENWKLNVSVLALVQTGEHGFRYNLDQQTSSHACQGNTVKVKAIHLRLHKLTHD